MVEFVDLRFDKVDIGELSRNEGLVLGKFADQFGMHA